MATLLPPTDPRTLAGLRARREAILAIAAAHYGTNLRVTGSVARGEATAKSDVDLIVDVDRDGLDAWEQFYNLKALRKALAKELGCRVDVIDAGTLSFVLEVEVDFTDYRKRIARQILAGAVPL